MRFLLTSFIGREMEMAEIQRLLQERRLVTLTGTGGSGKTRLAIEASALLDPDFPGGIHLVELAALSRAELVAETIARVLGLEEARDMKGVRPLVEVIAGFLGSRRTLLVLDNCEHLLDECAHICDTLLDTCPNLRILATSREPLGIAGESLFKVPLLSLPVLGPIPDPEKLLEFEAVRLFLDRARLADTRFALADCNAEAVAEVCERLDGIPLALELAAASLRMLPLSELAARLDQRFRLLRTGDRVAEPRHRTLQGLLDWSYTLLDERHKMVFRRLSVFPADWTIDAAELLCAGNDLPAGDGSVPPEEVLDIVMHLVDKSLVQLENSTGRYRMLETVRLYALSQLEAAGEGESAAHAHFAWYLEFAEKGTKWLGSSTQQEWLLRLENEQPNLRAALSWAIERGRSEEAARLALALGKFWGARVYHREARRWIEQILALDEASIRSPLPAQIRARLLGYLGTLGHTMNQFEQASRYHDEALRIWREQGDKQGIAAALHDLGWQHFEAMDLDGARRYAEESLALAHEAGDPAAAATAVNLFAIASVEAGRLGGLAPALEGSLGTWRELGALPEVATTLLILARVEQRLGNLDRAGRLMMESLLLQVSLGDYAGLIGYLVIMFYFVFDEGKPPKGPLTPGFQRMSYLDNGRLPHGAAPAARVLGAMAGWEERVTGESSRQWHRHSVPVLDKLRKEMGESNFTREFAAGKAMTIEEVVELAEDVARPAPEHRANQDVTIVARAAPSAPAGKSPISGSCPAGLTGREAEVLRLVAAGLTNAQAAERLAVTPRTINAHLTSIYSKMGVTRRAEAVRFAIEHDLA